MLTLYRVSTTAIVVEVQSTSTGVSGLVILDQAHRSTVDRQTPVRTHKSLHRPPTDRSAASSPDSSRPDSRASKAHHHRRTPRTPVPRSQLPPMAPMLSKYTTVGHLKDATGDPNTPTLFCAVLADLTILDRDLRLPPSRSCHSAYSLKSGPAI